MNGGFTWIESLFYFALFIILASISFISYDRWVLQNAVDRAADQLRQAMLYARGQAVLNGISLELCASQDQIHCDANWSSGQIVRSDREIFRVFPAISSRLKISWISNFQKNSGIIFTEEGEIKAQQGHFLVYNAQKTVLAKIIVTHSGRLRLEKEVD